MAGLDTSIPLGIKPIDFGDPNEGRMNALRAQMMQMQMQQGQFNMMKAQRDMQYQDQQRAQAAAAAARDKAAERDAINAFLKTGSAGYRVNPFMDETAAAGKGVASDAGTLGGQMYPDLQPTIVGAQPKNYDEAINALTQQGKVDAARKAMGQNQALNVNESSNVKLGEEKTKAEAAKIDSAMKTIAYHVTQIPAVTPENYATWRASVVKDIPGYDSVLAKEAPTDPNQFLQMMGQYQQLGNKMVADHYASVTEGEKTKIIGIRPGSREAYDVAGSEGTIKPAREPKSKIAQLIADRDNLDPKDPEFNIKLKMYEQAIQQETGVKSKDVATADATIANVEQNIKDIDALVKHPALKRNTGLLGAVNPASRIPGTADKDFDLRLQQVKGEAFLSAYNILRGAGAITEIEGTKATSAINRMNTALSTKDFLEAAKDATDILKLGAERAKNMKSKGTWGGGEMKAPGAASTPVSPAGGKVVNFEDL